jgi:5'-nucleotidase
MVICLSELGYKNDGIADDTRLAASSEHIDLIIGSESELFMKTPIIAQNKNKKEVIINHIGKNAIVLGNRSCILMRDYRKEIVFDNLIVGAKGNRWKKIMS